MPIHLARPAQVAPGVHAYMGVVCHNPAGNPNTYRQAVNALIHGIELQAAAIGNGMDPGGLDNLPGEHEPDGHLCDAGSKAVALTLTDSDNEWLARANLNRARASLLRPIRPAIILDTPGPIPVRLDQDSIRAWLITQGMSPDEATAELDRMMDDPGVIREPIRPAGRPGCQDDTCCPPNQP